MPTFYLTLPRINNGRNWRKYAVKFRNLSQRIDPKTGEPARQGYYLSQSSGH